MSLDMRTGLLLCSFGLAAFAMAAQAQQPAGAPGQNVDWPSPDGKFAFLASHGEDVQNIDLIDKKSGKKLQHLDDEDSSAAGWHVLWAPDSSRFALMTRLGHPIQGIDVYFRNGETFAKLDLPDLPEANIPDTLKRGKSFPHIASQNWQEARQWKKDGSLVVTIDTMLDGGNGGSIAATRTVVLGFDRSGKATIGRSTIKYKAEKN